MLLGGLIWFILHLELERRSNGSVATWETSGIILEYHKDQELVLASIVTREYSSQEVTLLHRIDNKPWQGGGGMQVPPTDSAGLEILCAFSIIWERKALKLCFPSPSGLFHLA